MKRLTPKQVLYLDFDGVLHHDAVYRTPGRGIYIDQVQAPGRTLFEWAGHLEVLLEPYPLASIVLSTTWVKSLRYSRVVKHLPDSLSRRVIGATYHSHYSDISPWSRFADSGPTRLRGAEVLADVRRRKPEAWVAVDDTDEGWTPELREHLVLCDSTEGLGDEIARVRLAAALARHFA